MTNSIVTVLDTADFVNSAFDTGVTVGLALLGLLLTLGALKAALRVMHDRPDL